MVLQDVFLLPDTLSRLFHKMSSRINRQVVFPSQCQDYGIFLFQIEGTAQSLEMVLADETALKNIFSKLQIHFYSLHYRSIYNA